MAYVVTGGLAKELFIELQDLMMLKWDPARRLEPPPPLLLLLMLLPLA